MSLKCNWQCEWRNGGLQFHTKVPRWWNWGPII